MLDTTGHTLRKLTSPPFSILMGKIGMILGIRLIVTCYELSNLAKVTWLTNDWAIIWANPDLGSGG